MPFAKLTTRRAVLILHAMNTALISRITSSPDICHGKPCLRGLRYPVAFVLELLNSGMTHQELLDDYEDLEADDLHAVEAYGTLLGRKAEIDSGATQPVPGETVAAEVFAWLAAKCSA